MNEIKCRDCRQEGHRSGDPACKWIEQATMHEERINDEEEFPGVRGDRSESQDTVVTLEKTASKPMEEPSKAPPGAVSSKPSICEKTKSRLRNSSDMDPKGIGARLKRMKMKQLTTPRNTKMWLPRNQWLIRPKPECQLLSLIWIMTRTMPTDFAL